MALDSKKDFAERVGSYLSDRNQPAGIKPTLWSTQPSVFCYAALPASYARPKSEHFKLGAPDAKLINNGSFGAVFQHPSNKNEVVKVLTVTKVKVVTRVDGQQVTHVVKSIESEAETELKITHDAFLLGCAASVSTDLMLCHFDKDVTFATDQVAKLANVIVGNTVQYMGYETKNIIKAGTTWRCFAMEKVKPWTGQFKQPLRHDLCQRILELNMPKNPALRGILHNDIGTRNVMVSLDEKRAVLIDYGLASYALAGAREYFTVPRNQNGKLDEFIQPKTKGFGKPVVFDKKKGQRVGHVEHGLVDILRVISVSRSAKFMVNGLTQTDMYEILMRNDVVIDALSWYLLVFKRGLEKQKFKDSTADEILIAQTKTAAERKIIRDWAARVKTMITNDVLLEKLSSSVSVIKRAEPFQYPEELKPRIERFQRPSPKPAPKAAPPPAYRVVRGVPVKITPRTFVKVVQPAPVQEIKEEDNKMGSLGDGIFEGAAGRGGNDEDASPLAAKSMQRRAPADEVEMDDDEDDEKKNVAVTMERRSLAELAAKTLAVPENMEEPEIEDDIVAPPPPATVPFAKTIARRTVPEEPFIENEAVTEVKPEDGEEPEKVLTLQFNAESMAQTMRRPTSMPDEIEDEKEDPTPPQQQIVPFTQVFPLSKGKDLDRTYLRAGSSPVSIEQKSSLLASQRSAPSTIKIPSKEVSSDEEDESSDEDDDRSPPRSSGASTFPLTTQSAKSTKGAATLGRQPRSPFRDDSFGSPSGLSTIPEHSNAALLRFSDAQNAMFIQICKEVFNME